jgi:hypothetical protein
MSPFFGVTKWQNFAPKKHTGTTTKVKPAINWMNKSQNMSVWLSKMVLALHF